MERLRVRWKTDLRTSVECDSSPGEPEERLVERIGDPGEEELEGVEEGNHGGYFARVVGLESERELDIFSFLSLSLLSSLPKTYFPFSPFHFSLLSLPALQFLPGCESSPISSA
jgi:hypothetical protein